MSIASDSTLDLLSSPRIVTADRLNDALVIEFDNGECALYPDAFLYSKIRECKALHEDAVEW